jgi:hypothetical protein
MAEELAEHHLKRGARIPDLCCIKKFVRGKAITDCDIFCTKKPTRSGSYRFEVFNSE